MCAHQIRLCNKQCTNQLICLTHFFFTWLVSRNVNAARKVRVKRLSRHLRPPGGGRRKTDGARETDEVAFGNVWRRRFLPSLTSHFDIPWQSNLLWRHISTSSDNTVWPPLTSHFDILLRHSCTSSDVTVLPPLTSQSYLLWRHNPTSSDVTILPPLTSQFDLIWRHRLTSWRHSLISSDVTVWPPLTSQSDLLWRHRLQQLTKLVPTDRVRRLSHYRRCSYVCIATVGISTCSNIPRPR